MDDGDKAVMNCLMSDPLALVNDDNDEDDDDDDDDVVARPLR